MTPLPPESAASHCRTALKRLGLTQVAGVRHLGVDARTVRRWVAGDRRIPEPVAILLRLWLTARGPK